MITEEQQRTLIRNAILQDLEAASPISLPLTTLEQGLRVAHAISATSAQIEKHLSYLVEKGFVEVTASAVSAGDKRYKLTASGREYLESEGLV